jgi:Arabinose-binding domain of AraC transcription regulator, N-term
MPPPAMNAGKTPYHPHCRNNWIRSSALFSLQEGDVKLARFALNLAHFAGWAQVSSSYREFMANAKAMVRHFRVPSALRTKLEELGVNIAAVLRTAGLPNDLFDQTRILVSTEQQFALWRAIGDVSKDPSIGLKLGNE